MARAAYVHEAVLVLDTGEDPRRPGAVITVELCGHWDHEGPCRWPHHTATRTRGDALFVRTVFAAEPSKRDEVLARIAGALRASNGRRVQMTGPAATTAAELAGASRWFDMPLPET